MPAFTDSLFKNLNCCYQAKTRFECRRGRINPGKRRYVVRIDLQRICLLFNRQVSDRRPSSQRRLASQRHRPGQILPVTPCPE